MLACEHNAPVRVEAHPCMLGFNCQPEHAASMVPETGCACIHNTHMLRQKWTGSARALRFRCAFMALAWHMLLVRPVVRTILQALKHRPLISR